MAQTNAQQRRARLRRRRIKRRVKQFVWASVFVAIGACLVHGPSGTTAQASTGGQAASSAVQSSDGTRQFNYLNTAYSATGATPTGYAIHDWTVLDANYHSEQQLEAIGQQLEQEFDLTNAKVTTRSEQNEKFYQVDGTWSGSTEIQLVLTSLQGGAASPQTTSTGSETVLTVTALGTSAGLNLFSAQYDAIEQTVSSVQGTPQMSAYFTGSLSAMTNEQQANTIASNALKSVHASTVEALRTTYETSLSGYSGDPLTYIDTNGKRMDLQVAVHDDTYHHRTDVLVGTPIITTTY
ncbi:YwmB family TATA-box binding protein [Alicyclobacillus fastidiosus]|uniref:YwmB family TATA-box binding protein n=1 Tax=Alicyclobacillus fastidiosus TaxID=392011 RepID=A0ABV5AFI8_9BACL|nr:YwmB family TATA-box binding protein [Alicyclobacillus fastidiosus]WEH09591.1 YwmB family TATA-box binding protein [Alicyclobacillus fastidiosus]